MGSAARLLAVMGSGETTPTMVKFHRELFERLGPGQVKAVLMDTPYGFQRNATDISSRAVGYFKESVGRDVEVASLPRSEGAGVLALEAALARVADANWVFAGPGSPTYALRQWRPTMVPQLLAEKLVHGGCVVFSSAAALTLGRFSVPVYEIYKAGADPAWAEGLDLLRPHGMPVAVIPHYDNAEGGTHDTRYCYLGEERLALLEEQLPDQAWVLGVDEHTACLFDLGAETVSVVGLGVVTVRRRGRSATVPSGATLSITELAGLAFGTGTPAAAGAGSLSAATGTPAATGTGAGAICAATGTLPATGQDARAPGVAGRAPGAALGGDGPATAARAAETPRTEATPALGGSALLTAWPRPAESPLMKEVKRLSREFDDAVAARDAGAATEAVLELESVLHAWSADTFQSDELDRARAALRRMVVRLGETAVTGLRDPREVLAPWVEALLVERAEARESRRFPDADRIRGHLEAAGVEVRDTPAGTQWDLRGVPSP